MGAFPNEFFIFLPITIFCIYSATSIWEVQKSPKKWKVLNVETSSLLEEAWRNNIRVKKLEKDVEVYYEHHILNTEQF